MLKSLNSEIRYLLIGFILGSAITFVSGNEFRQLFSTEKQVVIQVCLPPQIMGGGADPSKMPCEWRVVK